MSTGFDPMNWGWGMNNSSSSLIKMDVEPGPQDILENDTMQLQRIF